MHTLHATYFEYTQACPAGKLKTCTSRQNRFLRRVTHAGEKIKMSFWRAASPHAPSPFGLAPAPKLECPRSMLPHDQRQEEMLGPGHHRHVQTQSRVPQQKKRVAQIQVAGGQTQFSKFGRRT